MLVNRFRINTQKKADLLCCKLQLSAYISNFIKNLVAHASLSTLIKTRKKNKSQNL